MINSKILVSGADYLTNSPQNSSPINPYYYLGSSPVDASLAIREHAEIVKCFKECGTDIVQIDPPINEQDGVYTANWAFILEGTAFIANLPNARSGEREYARKTLAELGFNIVDVPSEFAFSGQGDMLKCGATIFCGHGYRTDIAAIDFIIRYISESNNFSQNYEFIILKTVPVYNRDISQNTSDPDEIWINPSTQKPDSYFFDIDLALSVISEELIAYCPDAFDKNSLAKIQKLPLKKIEVNRSEAIENFALNLVSTGESVIMSSTANSLKSKLESLGLKIYTPEISELKKCGGYIRCISLTLS
ncbi:MAG: hypothetical protein LBN03_02725 [Bifidobacteriaceae bacterium]|jgi:N-dimethylarginine dimethylaminohydrolase|nr:hypothetical protein [Bifidobacteriaceae bacterium]